MNNPINSNNPDEIRKLRTLNEIIKFIKSMDSGSSISRHFLETLILKHEVYYIKSGNRYLVDIDEVFEKLNLYVRKEQNVDFQN